MKLPEDKLLAEIIEKHGDLIWKIHDHDSLLEHQQDENLTEEERKAAWEEYENEKKGIVNMASSAFNSNTLNPSVMMQNIDPIAIKVSSEHSYCMQFLTMHQGQVGQTFVDSKIAPTKEKKATQPFPQPDVPNPNYPTENSSQKYLDVNLNVARTTLPKAGNSNIPEDPVLDILQRWEKLRNVMGTKPLPKHD